jgi:hypothetical protein
LDDLRGVTVENLLTKFVAILLRRKAEQTKWQQQYPGKPYKCADWRLSSTTAKSKGWNEFPDVETTRVSRFLGGLVAAGLVTSHKRGWFLLTDSGEDLVDFLDPAKRAAEDAKLVKTTRDQVTQEFNSRTKTMTLTVIEESPSLIPIVQGRLQLVDTSKSVSGV